MRSCILTTAVLLAFSAGLYAFDGDSWIVAGDQVRVRKGAHGRGAEGRNGGPV